MGSARIRKLLGQVFFLRVPAGSALAGATIAGSRLGELVGLTVSGIVREDRTLLAVAPDETIRPDDELIVMGDPERVRSLLALGSVELGEARAIGGIESEEVGVVEAVIAPRSRAAGRNLTEMHFREKHGLQALAVWREGQAVRAGLASLKLRFGDALLLQGPWSKIRLLGTDPDFVVLALEASRPYRTRKGVFAVAGLLLMIALVVTGFQPIHVAAFTAATFVVLTGAITMEEAYRGVEWRAIFLVAAILPVGIAMERTGAAALLSNGVTELARPLGPHAVLAALFVLSSLLSQCLDGAPAVVILTPVALQTASTLGISPYPVMMGVSLAASAAFMTPFSHKANLLVMGAGGYRVADYLRVGTPLTVLVLVALVVLVPLLFPI
jgi:di/tricarboxylate transporter